MRQFLLYYLRVSIRLEAHTDSYEEKSLQLCERRVLAVKIYLLNQGISPNRIEIRLFEAKVP